MMLLVFTIIFAQPVLLNPTGTLAQVLSFLPWSAPIIMPLRMTTSPVSALEIVASLGSVFLGCLIAPFHIVGLALDRARDERGLARA